MKKKGNHVKSKGDKNLKRRSEQHGILMQKSGVMLDWQPQHVKWISIMPFLL
jgi:hypothetical protein